MCGRGAVQIVFCWRVYTCISCCLCNVFLWVKCNGTQGDTVPQPPIYNSVRSPISDAQKTQENGQGTLRNAYNRGPPALPKIKAQLIIRLVQQRVTLQCWGHTARRATKLGCTASRDAEGKADMV